MTFFGYYDEPRAIARGQQVDPPDFYQEPEQCDGCGLLLEDCKNGVAGACVRCSVCGEAGKCDFVDCGANEGCTECPPEKHTKTGDCLYTDEAAARAEDLHLEEGMDDAREARA